MQPTNTLQTRLFLAALTLLFSCIKTVGQNCPPSDLPSGSTLNLGTGSGTIGEGNTFVGHQSGTQSNGNHNTFVGNHSGMSLQDGCNNVFIGSSSGLNLMNGVGNVFIGVGSGSQEADVRNRFYLQNQLGGAPLLYGEFDSGRIGIATENIPNGYALAVKGGIICDREVNIKMHKNWPDYVFDKEYDLMPIDQLENYISTHRRLPEIPSAEHIEKNGLPLGAMEVKMMKKIEEIHLYLIHLNKENEGLKNELIRTQTKLDSILNQAPHGKSIR